MIKYSGERSYEQSSTMSREQVKAKPRLSKGESSHNDGAYNNPQPHPMKTESQPHSVKTNSSSSTYRVGDRVRYHSKSCVPYEGVVKWIGSSTSTRNLNYVHVGILTVSFYLSILTLAQLGDSPALSRWAVMLILL